MQRHLRSPQTGFGGGGARWLALVVLILTMTLSPSPVATAEDAPPDGLTTDSSESLNPGDDAPVEILEPTPTPEPTPTQEPTPTVEPTAVELVPTIEPTATSEPATTPAIEPSPTPTPSPSPTPTVTRRSSMTISPQSASGPLCTLNGTDKIDRPGQLAAFACTNPMYQGGKTTLRISTPSYGWYYQVEKNNVRSPQTWASSEVDITGYDQFAMFLGFVDPKTTGCVRVDVTATSNDGRTTSSRLEARPQGTGWGSCTYEGGAAPPAPPTAWIHCGSLPALGFSFQERIVNCGGDLAIRVENGSQKAGWTLSASAQPFAYVAGPAPGIAGQWTSGFALMIRKGDGSWVPLSTTEAMIETSGGDAKDGHIYPMTLTVPGGAPAGEYSSTLTLNTAAAPGT